MNVFDSITAAHKQAADYLADIANGKGDEWNDEGRRILMREMVELLAQAKEPLQEIKGDNPSQKSESDWPDTDEMLGYLFGDEEGRLPDEFYTKEQLAQWAAEDEEDELDEAA